MNYQATRVMRALSAAVNNETNKKFQKKNISKQLQDIKRSDSKHDLHENVKKLENSISHVIDNQKSSFINPQKIKPRSSSDGFSSDDFSKNFSNNDSGFFSDSEIKIINSANSSSELDQISSVHLASRLDEVERLLSVFETIEHHDVDHYHVLNKFHNMKKKLHELEFHHKKEFTKSSVNDQKLLKENERLKKIIDVENEIMAKEEIIELLYHDHAVDPRKIEVLKLKIKDLKDVLEKLKN